MFVGLIRWLLLFSIVIAAASPASERKAALEAQARAGDTGAQLRLGWHYQTGIDTPIDRVSAAQWYARAAAQGNNDARNNLAMLYLGGFGDQSVDFKKAAALFSDAAAEGHVQAHYNLALLYRAGRGVRRNAAMSARLFSYAARGGLTRAQVALAKAYVRGAGVEKNLVEACMWAILASDALDEDGHALRLQLEQKLTPTEIIEAERRAYALLRDQ